MTLGISPGASAEDHVGRFRKPLDGLSAAVFTGVGVDQRGAFIVRSASAALFIGGAAGTLGEFAMAWMHGGAVLGVLEGVEGVSDHMRDLARNLPEGRGGDVCFSPDPRRLVAEVCARVDAGSGPPAPSAEPKAPGVAVRDLLRRAGQRGDAVAE